MTFKTFLNSAILAMASVVAIAQQPLNVEMPCDKYLGRPAAERLKDATLPRDCRSDAADEIGDKLDTSQIELLMAFIEFERMEPTVGVPFPMGGGKFMGFGAFPAANALLHIAWGKDEGLVVRRLRKAITEEAITDSAVRIITAALAWLYRNKRSEGSTPEYLGDPSPAIKIIVQAAGETQVPGRRTTLLNRAKFIASGCTLERRLDCTAALQGI